MSVPSIDYTARDFLVIKEALKTHLQTKFPQTWRDFYESCFTGDTKVSLVNGTEQSIESLVGKDSFWVYSYDPQKGRIVPGKATAKKTRENAELVEVTLDNNEKVKCTPDHRWMMRDGSYKEAKDLQPGDSLMPLYRRAGEYGYEELKQPDTKRWNLTHRCFVQGEIKELVHHKNYTKQDNTPENLVWVSFEEHGKIHDLKSKWQDPIMRAKLLEYPQSEEGRKTRSDNLTQLNHDPEFRKKCNAGHAKPESKKKKSIASKARWADPTGRQKMIAGIVLSSSDPEFKQRQSDIMTEVYQDAALRRKIGDAVLEALKDPEKKRHVDEGRRKWLESEEAKALYASEEWAEQCRQNKLKYFAREQHAETFNHKVVSVLKLEERQDCYCLFVDDLHNFALTAGVFVHNSAGIAILDIVCYAFDVLSFQTDYTANELYLETARDKDSVLQLGRLVGYQLRTPTSAAVTCVATLPITVTNPVVVPDGTAIKSVGGIDFVTTQETTLQPGVQGSIVFSQGVVKNDTFSSDGSSFQKFVLLNSPVIQDTLEVQVDGDTWDQVDSLAYCDGNSNEYSVKYDSDGVATIEFGDGTSGRVPPVASVITVAYRTGGGIQGNIALNQILTTVTGQEQAPGTPDVTVTVTNSAERGSGGEDAETVTHGKLWIPRWVKSNQRAVTEDDYDALANAFADPTYGAPAYAKAKLHQDIPELNTVDLYVWARDGSGNIVEPSTGLKTALSTYFNNNGAGSVKCICTFTDVLDGEIVYVDVIVQVKVATDYSTTDTLAAVRTAIDDFFNSANVQPGADFRISLLYNAIQNITGVEYCLVANLKGSEKVTELIGIGDGINTSFSDTLVLEPGLTIVPGTVSVTYGTPVTETLTDDGDGIIVDSVGTAVGTIDYETGAITVTFAAIPAVSVLINCEYRYLLDYQRGELEATGDGVTKRFHKAVEYPPVNPYHALSGEKGIAFSDGTQVVTDDGNGALVGDVDPAGRNVIDYDTGGYDFTFFLPPQDQAEIMSTYRQILDTPSEDIPIDKNQIGVKGDVTVSAL